MEGTRLRPASLLLKAGNEGDRHMGSAVYRIAPHGGGWGVLHDGETVGPYETKEAAFEATAAAASIAMREGHSIEITAPGREVEGFGSAGRAGVSSPG
jgi:hypothetical protein